MTLSATVQLPVLVLLDEDGRLGLSVQTDGLLDALVDAGEMPPETLGRIATAILAGRVKALPLDMEVVEE